MSGLQLPVLRNALEKPWPAHLDGALDGRLVVGLEANPDPETPSPPPRAAFPAFSTGQNAARRRGAEGPMHPSTALCGASCPRFDLSCAPSLTSRRSS